MKVFCYWNLHKFCWSVKALEGDLKGKVVAHFRELTLKDCQLKVSEAGRQRVLQERKKNVHAGIVGNFQFEYVEPTDSCVRLRYNPYVGPHFTAIHSKDGDLGPRIRQSRVSLDGNGKAWAV